MLNTLIGALAAAKNSFSQKDALNFGAGTTKIRFTQAAWEKLCTHHRHQSGKERCSAAFGRVITHAHGRTVLVTERDLVIYQPTDYTRQSMAFVQLSDAAVRRLMWTFAQSGCDALITMHDHFFAHADTQFSGTDDAQDLKRDHYLREVFEPMLQKNPGFGAPRSVLHIALVFDQSGYDARIVDCRLPEPLRPIDGVQVVGKRFASLAPNSAKQPAKHAGGKGTAHMARLARHKDFIPDEVCATLRGLTVGVVGCGGLGPMVAENLARLGVGRLLLIDSDRLEESNLNRWLAGEQSQVGRYKVELLAERLSRSLEGLSVVAVPENVLDATGQAALRGCDLIFAAVDCDGARFAVNRIAVQQLVPYFDLGVLVQVQPCLDFQTRIVPVLPGTSACLECSALGLLNQKQIARGLDGNLDQARESAGYAPQIQASAPSVMGLNMWLAGLVTLDLIAYLTGASQLAGGAEQNVPLLKTMRWRTGRITAVTPAGHAPSADCACCVALLGVGDAAEVPKRRSAEDLRAVIAGIALLLPSAVDTAAPQICAE